MAEDIKQDRSPRSPKFPLEDAINQTKKLYDNAGRSVVSRDMAAKAMGYAGLNGAALTNLATLTQYGLLERQGEKVSVSPLALKIFHPGIEGVAPAIREAALTAPLFGKIYDSHHQLSEQLLANHLVHEGFTQDAAKKVAKVYKQNAEFAKLDLSDLTEIESVSLDVTPVSAHNSLVPRAAAPVPMGAPLGLNIPLSHVVTEPSEKPIKQFHLPLDENSSVELRFMGDTEFGVDQIDSLVDILVFLKQQLTRKKSAQTRSDSVEGGEEP